MRVEVPVFKGPRLTSGRVCVQGHPEAVIPSIQAKLLPMMIANFAVWPIAHLINFKFIPSQQR